MFVPEAFAAGLFVVILFYIVGYSGGSVLAAFRDDTSAD